MKVFKATYTVETVGKDGEFSNEITKTVHADDPRVAETKLNMKILEIVTSCLVNDLIIQCISLDSIECVGNSENIIQEPYLRPVPHTIKAPGLPTYDSIMIDMPFSRYVLQGGIDFDPSLFLEYTYGASRVVDWTLVR